MSLVIDADRKANVRMDHGLKELITFVDGYASGREDAVRTLTHE